jgi:polyphosphate kinase 2
MTDQTVTKKQNTLQSTTRKKTTRKKTTRKKVAKTTVSQTAYRKLTRELSSVKEDNEQLMLEIEELKSFKKGVHRKNQQEQGLKPYQAELIQVQKCLERRGKKMIIVLEGRGGAGKAGAIRRITHYMNAKHYRVVALGKPTDEERTQWYYQKYVKEFPRAGEIVLFDRSWYTRAMIEPAFGFCTDEEYENFMEGVAGFEKDLTDQGLILIKFYFSVSRQEQSRRFKQRRNDPLQSWKLSEVDLDAEEFRDEFTELKYEMLKRSHTIHAPWTIIRSDNKHQARLNALKVILNYVNYDPINPDLDITPDNKIVVSGAYELERMEAQRVKLGIR